MSFVLRQGAFTEDNGQVMDFSVNPRNAVPSFRVEVPRCFLGYSWIFTEKVGGLVIDSIEIGHGLPPL
jgi:hypothetical protein